MSPRPHLVLVGGFLGAGKTTLIMAAARELARRGLRSAAIMNDQGEALVDTQLIKGEGIPAEEVTGGCFCCRFTDLARAAEQLRGHSPDVIFAEPVGSCTDISATTILPLRSIYGAVYQIAPYTVLVDPLRARTLSESGGDPDLRYLFHKQLEEADVVCITKADLYPDCPELPQARQMSAKTGQGVAAWLDEVLSGRLAAGGRVLDIDYERYARAEAALAWLNVEMELDGGTPVSPAMLLGPLIDRIDAELTAAKIPIVHLKAIDDSSAGFLKVALTASGAEPVVEGGLDASPASRHKLLLNLRAAGAPEKVREIVERELERLNGRRVSLHVTCFSPAAPKPEYRMVDVNTMLPAV